MLCFTTLPVCLWKRLPRLRCKKVALFHLIHASNNGSRKDNTQRLWNECASNLSLTLSQVEKLEHFARLLMEHNQNVNLTAIRDWDQVIVKHCIDSLTLVPLIKKLSSNFPTRLVDVGSGGGIPGIPLAIAVPDCNITLIDKTRKKVEIQQRIIEQLQLHSVRCLWTRVEVAGQQEEMRESFDFVTARAVASLDILVEWTIPFLKEGGYLLAQKSVDAQCSEIKRACNAIDDLITDERR
ncbi:Ribosomal RNA small subunit methyltransferase G [Galdieria sulphuraria]|nr:Ribosomal RNA small subunit methyltransferase G [Galdieria sulphuraria]